ncbi:MAG: hypothetical protein ACOC3V_00175 [bacterium]
MFKNKLKSHMRKIYVKLKSHMRKIYVKLQYTKIALLKINNPHLGDVVIYNNTKCLLIQGVSKPYWNLLPLTKENLEKSTRETFKHVHENKFKLKPMYKRFISSFNFTYKFYMSYWYDIDINKSGKISYISL